MKIPSLNMRGRQILFVCFAFILMIAISIAAANNMLVMPLAGIGLMFMLSFVIYRQHNRMEKNNNAVIQLMENLAKDEKEKHRIEIAEASRKAQTEFLAAMSHEIRTPMNAIIGITQIQMQKEELPKEYSQALYKIYASGINLLGIINNILDISKIESGKFEIKSSEYDVPCLINDSVQVNISRIGSKEIKFLIDVDENLPLRLCGDELRLKQILNNLLSNAIKYTSSGYVKLSVSHSIQDGSDITLRFTVEDTGQGMKGEDQELLFSEYMRFNTAANRTTEGTGLGLNITRKLVEMMDGTIQVQSESGKGSTFIVEVKQEAADCGIFDTEPIGAQLAEKIKNFTFSGDRQMSMMQFIRFPMPYGKVLVVDDLEANLYVAEGLLAPYKLEIETADSGFAAIEKIESDKSYDIIFMDHMMPTMDGVQTTQKLRAQGYTGVIVALTANALVGNEDIFKQKGFDGFIAKPIDLQQLNAALNTFIRDKYPQEAVKYTASSTATEPEPAAALQPSADLQPVAALQPAADPKLIQIFCRDAEKAVVTLRETANSGNLKLFATTVHAMKPVLANLRENEMSDTAFNLEKAGLNGDTDFIRANTENFITKLENLIKKLCAETPVDSESVMPRDSNVTEDTAYLTEQLKKVKTASEDYNAKTALAILDQIKEKQWKPETMTALEKIRDALFLHSDFEGACEQIDVFLGEKNEN